MRQLRIAVLWALSVVSAAPAAAKLLLPGEPVRPHRRAAAAARAHPAPAAIAAHPALRGPAAAALELGAEPAPPSETKSSQAKPAPVAAAKAAVGGPVPQGPAPHVLTARAGAEEQHRGAEGASEGDRGGEEEEEAEKVAAEAESVAEEEEEQEEEGASATATATAGRKSGAAKPPATRPAAKQVRAPSPEQPAQVRAQGPDAHLLAAAHEASQRSATQEGAVKHEVKDEDAEGGDAEAESEDDEEEDEEERNEESDEKRQEHELALHAEHPEEHHDELHHVLHHEEHHEEHHVEAAKVWKQAGVVAATRHLIRDNQESQAAVVRVLDDLRREPEFQRRVEQRVWQVGNQTQSPALARSLGEMWKEMRKYNAPFFMAHLEAQRRLLQKHERELHSDLTNATLQLHGHYNRFMGHHEPVKPQVVPHSGASPLARGAWVLVLPAAVLLLGASS